MLGSANCGAIFYSERVPLKRLNLAIKSIAGSLSSQREQLFNEITVNQND